MVGVMYDVMWLVVVVDCLIVVYVEDEFLVWGGVINDGCWVREFGLFFMICFIEIV